MRRRDKDTFDPDVAAAQDSAKNPRGCKSCNETGTRPGTDYTCGVCHGTGEL
ncbi:hypothetical protein [Amycolatopsis suaedae]|uniref:hypothetical protein n=1 Tax=Amycolatopsis suaedae TaxID=2510978 RepID=UPI0013EF56B6|nr:hypothetical protein [Amycolatopsis suaedae]